LTVAKILVVDDEPRMADVVARSLRKRGHEVHTAGDGAEALKILSDAPFDLVFTDHRMEPMDGMELLTSAKERWPQTHVVMMTAYGEVENAVVAMRAGAAHYLNKPVDLDELNLLAERLVADREFRRDHERLRELSVRQSEAWDLLGESEAMKAIKDLVLRVAPTDATVLIRGESGTGKELTARAIHRHSLRRKGPFVAVNCAAIPDSLLESELFGYMKGAFTGADKDKAGFFELANKGTIFLDELGEANAGVQSKLLRVLEDRRFIPVGGRHEIEVDVRIVAATNKDLERLIEEERFREDLFYRFNVFPIDLPPLRQRLEDLEDLAAHLLSDLGRDEDRLEAPVLKELRSYPWPGNVRELRNVLERAHILAGGDAIGSAHIHLPAARGAGRGGHEPMDLNLEAHEKRLIQIALKRAGGNKTRAAEMLGLTRRALYSRMERLDIPIDSDGTA
jgi:DNA-binding NtrC family response regulator